MAEKLTEKTFQFELVSPEQILASEEAYMAVIPGEAGDFGVLADHAPLLSSLRPGVVKLTLPDMTERRIFVAGGFADINGQICSVLAEEAVNVDSLDRAALENELRDLQDDLNFAAADQIKTARIQRQMGVVRAKLAALNGAVAA